MAKQKYYFTFGFGQKHEGGYHVIEAENVDEARAEMNCRFDKWSFCYESAEEAGVKEFGLHEVLKPIPMFTVHMFENTIEITELAADFRTLEAARTYTMDCAKTLCAPGIEKISDSPHCVEGLVKDPEGKIVWYTSSAPISLALDEVCVKMHLLNSEELKHIEFTVDAFLKRKEHED